MSSAAIWQEVEWGGYGADLETWERLADAARGPILELGAGVGRVSLHLAARGHAVCAVDSDPSLVAALEAAAGDLEVEAVCADIRSLSLKRSFHLILAPMQVVQALGGAAERRAALRSAAAHLEPGGRLAAAIVELDGLPPEPVAVGLPDVRERDGWVYSSLPVAVAGTNEGLEVRRLRQAVSPWGELSEEKSVERIDPLDPEALEAEARETGLEASERLQIPPEDEYLGSVVVVLERPR